MRFIKLGTLLILLLAGLAGGQAAAQDDTEVAFPVDAYACDTAPGPGAYDPTGLSGPPADCVPAAGVLASVTGPGGDLGSCTTGADGRCVVPLLFGDMVPEVSVAVDPATMPAGYDRLQLNPITVPANLEHGALFAGILTVSEPDPPSQPDPPADGEGASLALTMLDCPPTGPHTVVDHATCTTPADGVDVAIGTPNSGNVQFLATDASGGIALSLDPFDLAPGPDTILVGEVLASNPAGEVVGWDAGCVDEATGASVPLDFVVGEVAPGGTTYEIHLAFDDGDRIACTWFNIYQATGDQPPATTPVPTATAPVTKLPATGAGPEAETVAESGGIGGWALGATAALLLGSAALTRRLARADRR